MLYAGLKSFDIPNHFEKKYNKRITNEGESDLEYLVYFNCTKMLFDLNVFKVYFVGLSFRLHQLGSKNESPFGKPQINIGLVPYGGRGFSIRFFEVKSLIYH